MRTQLFRTPILFLLTIITLPTLGFAQGNAYLVKDINPNDTVESSFPEDFIQMGNYVYFTCYDYANYGDELWRTDGTTAGTEIVHDIRAGRSGSSPESFAVLNGILYFSADDGVSDDELFRSDGTAQGTYLVKKIYQGISSSDPEYLTPLNNHILFTADDNINGTELWITDGTEAGTQMLKDIQPGYSSSYPEDLVSAGNKVYFIADDGSTGEELWVTDGTQGGTMLLKDINPGSSDGDIDKMTDINGVLYFHADDGTNGRELWKSDGTPGGTVMVKDINPGSSSSSPDYFTQFNGTVYFSANDGTTNSELWKTDGTSGGTMLVKDINPGAGYGVPREITNVNNQFLVFRADDGINGQELWKSDGTSNGTVLVKDINTGPMASQPNTFTVIGNQVMFNAHDNQGFGVWISDGTPGGTTFVKNVNITSSRLVFNGKILFSGYGGSGDFELWSSDGTTSGTMLLKNISSDKAHGWPQKIIDVNGTLFFGATDQGGGTRGGAWSSDGTTGGTQFIMPITGNSLPLALDLVEIGRTGNQALISARSAIANGYQLFQSDGTPGGTALLSADASFASTFKEANGRTYFRDGSFKLWETDGTTVGTDTVASTYFPVINFNGALGSLFFTGSKGNVTGGLWKTDGLSISLIKDINPTGHDQVNFGVDWNGYHYFSASDTVLNTEVWKTNGTPQNTVKLKEINPASHSVRSPSNFAVSNNKLFFTASDGSNGYEVWYSDGTESGTNLLKDIHPGPSDSDPAYLTDLNGKLIFSASTPTQGNELWVSDGTPGGTQILKDILPGPANGVMKYPNRFVVLNNMIYFIANDGQNGTELWQTDGTPAGTKMAADINPGLSGSSPMELIVTGGKLYFSAFHPDYGRELWAYEPLVGINPIDEFVPLNLFPNPAKEQITILLPTTEIDRLEIIDITGRVVQTEFPKSQASHTLTISKLPSGMYFVRAMKDGIVAGTVQWVKTN